MGSVIMSTTDASRWHALTQEIDIQRDVIDFVEVLCAARQRSVSTSEQGPGSQRARRTFLDFALLRVVLFVAEHLLLQLGQSRCE
jgi:hypothetical protein